MSEKEMTRVAVEIEQSICSMLPSELLDELEEALEFLRSQGAEEVPLQVSLDEDGEIYLEVHGEREEPY